MDLFSAMKISSSGMKAQRLRLEVVSSNLANINTTRTPEGGPYKRKSVVFEASPIQKGSAFSNTLDSAIQGVNVSEVKEDKSPPRMVYNPSHPDADERGYVAMPNVNMMEEMLDMLNASRSYEANAMAVNTAKSMAQKALDMGR